MRVRIGAADEAKPISGANIPLNPEKLVFLAYSPLKIDLNDWEKGGLKITIQVEGLGHGYYNDEPYSDKETALREYDRILAQVQSGNYRLEVHDKHELKLVLDSP